MRLSAVEQYKIAGQRLDSEATVSVATSITSVVDNPLIFELEPHAVQPTALSSPRR